MISNNEIMLEGTLGKDPELKYVGAKNTELATFSIAVNKKDKLGNQQATWVNCQAWKQVALTVMDHLRKGDMVTVRGELEIQSWADKTSGQKRYKTVVTVWGLYKKLRPKGNASANARTSNATPDDAPEDPEDTPF